MEFEDILEEVGDFGLYQILLVIVFLIPASIIIPWVSMNAVFVASTPDHWCHVPEIENLELSIDDQKRLIRPPSDPTCTRYDVNFTNILQSENFTVDANWPVRKCDLGWQYDTSNYDETAVTKWNLVCDNDYFQSTIVSFVFVGVIFGTPIYGYLSDRYGRKKIFLICAMLVAVAELVTAFCPYLTLFLILRVIIGSTMSSLYNLGYILILELVRQDLRGSINGIVTNCWTFGMCLLALTAYFTRSWVYLSLVMSAVAACAIFYFKILPESPCWLISQERYEEAAEILEKISKINKKNVKRDQLLQDIQNFGKLKQKEKAEKVSPLDLFKYPTMRRRFILLTITWIGVAVSYYGLTLNVTNLYGNEFFNFFLISIVELPAHLTAWWLLANLGRIRSTQFGFAVTALACLVPVFFTEEFENMGVIVSIIAKAGAGASFMAQYQMGPEIFPTSLRGVGMGLTSTIGNGFTLVVPYITQLKKHGTHIPYLVFAVISVIAGICSIFLPETLNVNLPQTLADVENDDRNEKCSYGWNGSKNYDVERKISFNQRDIIPTFHDSREV